MSDKQFQHANPIATPNLRVCLRPPIPEIAVAGGLLNDAVSAHLDGRFGEAASLIEQANLPPIMEWAKSLVGKRSKYNMPRTRLDSPATVPQEQREKTRMPSSESIRLLHIRYGFHCSFCGTPVFRKPVRTRLLSLYPDAIPWRGIGEYARHSALYVMGAQYDHVLPHSRGGGNDLENFLVTCYSCNFGRGNFTLVEMGLLDPRQRKPIECVLPGWDGLERLLQ